MGIENMIEEAVGRIFEEPDFTDCYLIEVARSPSGVVTVYFDSDQGVTLAQCTVLSRRLNALLEEAGFDDPSFSLEVSSPGVDKPLMLWRQYPKHIGRQLKVLRTDGEEIQGILTAVNDETLTLDAEISLDKSEIRESYVQIRF